MSTITIIGNATADVELTFTQSGVARANLTVAENIRRFDKQRNEWVDERTDFHRVTIWRELAEAVAEQVRKGAAVVVVGELESRTVEKDGDKRTYWGVIAKTVAVQVRANRRQAQATPPSTNDDPWGSSVAQGGVSDVRASADDSAPF